MGISLQVLRTKIRVIPRWAKISAAAILLLLAAALIAPFFINVDFYRPAIAAAMEAQTGRRVTLGKLRLRFLPRVGFVLENFHLGNPPGFPSGDLISAVEIRGNVALAPLLAGNVHLTSLELVSARIELITDEHGGNNYTFSPSPAPRASAAGFLAVADVSGQSPQTSSVSLEQIDQIQLTNTEFVLSEAVQRALVPSADVRKANMTVRNFAVNPLDIRGWQAESKLSGTTVIVGGWSAPVTFHSGELIFSNGKLNAQFVADLLNAGEVRGTFSVPDVQHPQMNFEMSAAQLDLDTLLAVAGGAVIGSSGAAKSPDPPFDPPSDPNQLVASGHLNIEKITSKPYAVGPANADVRVYADRMELWPIAVAMYGGTLQVSARVDRAAAPERFSANVQLRGADVAKALAASPSARGKMSGTGDLDLQLVGSLADAWKKTLSGNGKFSVRNGRLPGVNLAGAAQPLAKLAGIGADTPFSSLAGDMNIVDQHIFSRQIQLDSSSGVVDLRGNVSFDGALDYQGQVTLSATSTIGASPLGSILGSFLGGKGGKFTVPFALRGTIAHPQIAPGSGLAPSGVDGHAANTSR